MHLGDEPSPGRLGRRRAGGPPVPSVSRGCGNSARGEPRAPRLPRAQAAPGVAAVPLGVGSERVPVHGAVHLHVPVRRRHHHAAQGGGHGACRLGAAPRHRRAAQASLAATPARHAAAPRRQDGGGRHGRGRRGGGRGRRRVPGGSGVYRRVQLHRRHRDAPGLLLPGTGPAGGASARAGDGDAGHRHPRLLGAHLGARGVPRLRARRGQVLSVGVRRVRRRRRHGHRRSAALLYRGHCRGAGGARGGQPGVQRGALAAAGGGAVGAHFIPLQPCAGAVPLHRGGRGRQAGRAGGGPGRAAAARGRRRRRQETQGRVRHHHR
mmetsp:Transcript_14752/g.36100  ORF Transcript_14752/g.36100 Transcript_14752/m.36100 type:complete len:322 (+) Transcript_14752:1261-2226(+)